MTKEIKENLDKIREECDEIEEKVEPKKVTTYGDPICEFY